MNRRCRRGLLIALMVPVLLLFATATPAFADGSQKIDVRDFDEFQAAVRQVNAGDAGSSFTLNLTGDIDYQNESFFAVIRRDTTILGNGHTIDLGTDMSNAMIEVTDGATLTLGQEGGGNELTITSAGDTRSIAALLVGTRDAGATLDMHDGVRITGLSTNGASLGSAVVISNGTFNMYGGEISHTLNEADASMGGAVAGDGRWLPGDAKIAFNMYGGSIHDNTAGSDYSKHVLGLGVFMYGDSARRNVAFTMRGGSIANNSMRAGTPGKGYGGGLYLGNAEVDIAGGNIENNDAGYCAGGMYLFNSTARISGATISGNRAAWGGGIYVGGDTDMTVSGSTIAGNGAGRGGGIYYGSTGTSSVGNGSVVANNTATKGGADVLTSLDGRGSLELMSAADMGATMVTDGTNLPITGWFRDDEDARWSADSAKAAEPGGPITESRGLVAAHARHLRVTYRFQSGTDGHDLPNEVAALLPVDTMAYATGEKVIAAMPERERVTADGGTWAFAGYDAESKVVGDGDLEFVGTWTFKADSGQPSVGPGAGENPAAGGNGAAGKRGVGKGRGDSGSDGHSGDRLPATGDAAPTAALVVAGAASAAIVCGMVLRKRQRM